MLDIFTLKPKYAEQAVDILCYLTFRVTEVPIFKRKH